MLTIQNKHKIYGKRLSTERYVFQVLTGIDRYDFYIGNHNTNGNTTIISISRNANDGGAYEVYKDYNKIGYSVAFGSLSNVMLITNVLQTAL